MEEMYGFHSSTTSNYTTPQQKNLIISPAENLTVDHYWPLICGSDDLLPVAAASIITDAVSVETTTPPRQIIPPRRRINLERDELKSNVVVGDDAFRDTIKEKIVSHPSFSKLLDAYIDCQKVGAPTEIVSLLEDILRKENEVCKRNVTTAASTCLGADPELDQFMEALCDLLVKYKSDLATPLEEATKFIGSIKRQLRNLSIDECGISSSEEDLEDVSRGETDNTHMSQLELKDRLLRKFGGGGISSLKHEFTKKKKKGKLPKEARQTLLDWWTSHYKWPYPTEGDKTSLAETTGLDPKQINNWFINQRKRHWKPSESMQLAILCGLPLPLPLPDQYITYDD